MSSGPTSDVSPGRGLIEAFNRLHCVIRARMFLTQLFDVPQLVSPDALTEATLAEATLTGAAKEDNKTL